MPKFKIDSPWAVLLCKFNDDTTKTPPHPRKFYENLFTSAGTGTQSMVNYFSDMSHGRLDLSKSQIFPLKDGWFTLKHSYKEFSRYVDATIKYYATPVMSRGGLEIKPPLPENPNGLFLRWAKETATSHDSKVDLSEFHGVIAVANVGSVGCVGWTGGMAAICDDYSVKPSILGQEMGHGYGLSHSRIHGSEEDYRDPWDIMSTRAAFMAPHPDYDSIYWPKAADQNKSIGPGLNAANMDGRGWLDYSRVRKITRAGKIEVDLRPLHELESYGDLAIRIDEFYVEFRMNYNWDAGFSEPLVLIHYFRGNQSYIMPDTKKNYGLTKGSVFEIKRGSGKFQYNLRIEVLDINVGRSTAKILVDYSPPAGIDFSIGIRDPIYITLPWERETPAIPLSEISPTKDIVTINEKLIRTPEWSLQPILKSLADISLSERFNNEEIIKTIRREALKSIIQIAYEELNELDHFHGVYTTHPDHSDPDNSDKHSQ
jgi:hypothetical protein